MKTTISRIGLIGTGIMGAPIGLNLIKAGFALHVHNRTRNKAEPLLATGGTWCESPAAVADAADAVITIVSDTPDVEAVYLGNEGIATSIGTGTLCIDMSTVSPEMARHLHAALARKNCGFLDAPVSGGKTGAEAGSLTFMVGGDEEHFSQAAPILHAVGRNIVHCGPAGHGQLTKLCNQILCGLNLLAVAEAMVFAEKVGVDKSIMLQTVSTGAAGSWALDNLGSRMIARDFNPMFMIDLQQKDLRLVMESARDAKVPLPGTALVSQLLTSNQAVGEGREGTQALVKTLERLAAKTR